MERRATRNAYPPTANQISTITIGSNVRSFSYLASGQVSQDVRDASHTYTFAANDNGRNASASLNSSTVGSYLYNAFEQRVQKIAGGTTTQFVFDRFGHLLEEANASGVVQKEYIWLDDLPVAMVDDTGSSPVIYTIHTDQLGTPQKMTDGSGNVVWDGVTDPFGIAVSVSSLWGSPNQWGSFTYESTTPETINLRFPGQYFDAETSLNQNWFGDYDPTIGKYIQSDPIGLRGGDANTYRYVFSEPLNRIDPRGLWEVEVGGGLEGGVLVRFGYNGGQFNFGFYFGAGAGAFASYDREDTGCKPTGFVGGTRGEADLGLNTGVAFESNLNGENSVSVGVSDPTDSDISWSKNLLSPDEPPSPSVTFGGGAFIGFGGTSYF